MENSSSDSQVEFHASRADNKSKSFSYYLRLLFIRLGVLPFLLLIAVIVFALISDNYLSGRNLMNVVRQSLSSDIGK